MSVATTPCSIFFRRASSSSDPREKRPRCLSSLRTIVNRQGLECTYTVSTQPPGVAHPILAYSTQACALPAPPNALGQQNVYAHTTPIVEATAQSSQIEGQSPSAASASPHEARVVAEILIPVLVVFIVVGFFWWKCIAQPARQRRQSAAANTIQLANLPAPPVVVQAPPPNKPPKPAQQLPTPPKPKPEASTVGKTGKETVRIRQKAGNDLTTLSTGGGDITVHHHHYPKRAESTHNRHDSGYQSPEHPHRQSKSVPRPSDQRSPTRGRARDSRVRVELHDEPDFTRPDYTQPSPVLVHDFSVIAPSRPSFTRNRSRFRDWNDHAMPGAWPP